MEAFRLVDAPMLEARRSRAAALAGSEDAEGLAERAAAGERLTDEELAALLLSPRISTEALLAIFKQRMATYHLAERLVVFATRVANHVARDVAAQGAPGAYALIWLCARRAFVQDANTKPHQPTA